MIGHLLAFLVTVSAQSSDCGRLWLTEVHPDPKEMSDAQGEFVEVYNPSDIPQPLADWELEVNGRRVALPARTLGPQGIVLLGRVPMLDAHEVILLPALRLPNRSTTIRFLDPCGVERQSLTWGKRPGLRVRSGRSFTLVPRRSRLLWRHSRRRTTKAHDFATPGRLEPRLSQRLASTETRPRPVDATPNVTTRRARQRGDSRKE